MGRILKREAAKRDLIQPMAENAGFEVADREAVQNLAVPLPIRQR